MNDDTSSEEEECSLINLLCYMEINAFDIPVVLVDQCLFYCFCRSLNNERNLNFSTVSPKSQVQMMNEIMAKDLSWRFVLKICKSIVTFFNFLNFFFISCENAVQRLRLKEPHVTVSHHLWFILNCDPATLYNYFNSRLVEGIWQMYQERQMSHVLSIDLRNCEYCQSLWYLWCLDVYPRCKW